MFRNLNFWKLLRLYGKFLIVRFNKIKWLSAICFWRQTFKSNYQRYCKSLLCHGTAIKRCILHIWSKVFRSEKWFLQTSFLHILSSFLTASTKTHQGHIFVTGTNRNFKLVVIVKYWHSLDIDECKKDPEEFPCHEKATCYNIEGSFYCKCDLGWEGNGTSCEGESKVRIFLNSPLWPFTYHEHTFGGKERVLSSCPKLFCKHLAWHELQWNPFLVKLEAWSCNITRRGFSSGILLWISLFTTSILMNTSERQLLEFTIQQTLL